MDFLKDFIGFLASRKKIWLIPAMVLLCLIGGLVVLVGGSAIAPFIYALF